MVISDLQSLIEKACDLQEKVNEEINNDNDNDNNSIVGFCNKYNWCSEDEDKWFCKFADTPLILDEETHRLIGLRDSLKQLEDMLIHLQKMRAWHFINRQVAVKQVEESRAILMEKVSNYGGKPHSVISELNSNFGNNNGKYSALNKSNKTNSTFLFCCMKLLCNPETWQGVIGGAAKLIAASITVSSTLYFCRRRHQYCRSSLVMRHIPNRQLDVFRGRG